MRYEFLIDTYETERIKVISVWSMFRDQDLPVRPNTNDPRGRSFHEHMVHQCVSEDIWFLTMLGIDVGAPPLPKEEIRLEFIRRWKTAANASRYCGPRMRRGGKARRRFSMPGGRGPG
jgi:hypothetical protein